jgi:hypothetical protein
MKTRKRTRTNKCPRGMIRRKAYTRKNGTRVKSSCIKDMGKPGKGPKLFTLKKGGLSKYGYHVRDSYVKRHTSLKKALKHMSYATLVRKINALSILFKNTQPGLAKHAKSDVKWLQKQHISK